MNYLIINIRYAWAHCYVTPLNFYLAACQGSSCFRLVSFLAATYFYFHIFSQNCGCFGIVWELKFLYNILGLKNDSSFVWRKFHLYDVFCKKNTIQYIHISPSSPHRSYPPHFTVLLSPFKLVKLKYNVFWNCTCC